MKRQYLIRLDDACPTMDHAKWQRMEDILDRYVIKPMVGVIPHNEDAQQKIDAEDYTFWRKVKQWESKGWAIALHGYNHSYSSQEGLKGLNPFWKFSEFAGLSLDLQREKIRKGVEIMRENNIYPNYFFAPSHTFDENTLNALREESEIRIVSDTLAIKPYKFKDFVFIPQFGGHCRNMILPGLYTFCFHPNTMSNADFEKTDNFLQSYHKMFTSFEALNLDGVKCKSLFDRLLSFGYFAMRRLKKR